MDGLVDLSVVVKSDEPELPEDIGALALLQMVYRGKVKVSLQQMRAAIESLPFESPKLTAQVNLHFDASFAALLDKAIERRQRPLKLIEAQPVPTQQSAEELKGPMSRLRRV